MTEFVLENSEVIGAAAVALVLIIYALIVKEWAVLKAAAYSLMLSVERLMSTEEGEKKMDLVFRAMWERIPKWGKVFVTERAFRERLQEWYLSGKEQSYK
jgi:hypothetical protein